MIKKDLKEELLTNNKSILSHLVLDSFGGKDVIEEDIEKLAKSDKWIMEIKINDVNVSPIDVEIFLNELWQRSFKRCLEDKAKEMYEERWNNTFGVIETILEKATELREDDLLQYPWER